MSMITAKASQAAAKAKAARLVGMSNTEKPFYPEGENAGDKTGMRPITKRQFKKGGKVVGKADGSASAARADRPKRKAGGRIGEQIANMDVKAANKKRAGGKDHVGGLKKGGRIKRGNGGEMPSVEDALKSASRLKEVRVEREDNDRLPSAKEAAARSGKYQNYKKGGKIKKAFGGPSDRLQEQVGKNPIEEMKNVGQLQADRAVAGGGPSGMFHGSMRKNGGSTNSKTAKSDEKAWSKYKSDAKENGVGEKDAEESKAKFKPASKKAFKNEKPFVSKDIKMKPVEEKKKFAPIEEVEVDDFEPDDEYEGEEMLKRGGRTKKWAGGGFSAGTGGKKKSKSRSAKKNITNIVIQTQPPVAEAAQKPMANAPRSPDPTAPSLAEAGAGGPPMPPLGAMAPNPQMPPPQMPPPGAGMPMMPPEGMPPMRKSGGRVNYAALKAGAGSGLGRLKKAGVSAQ